MNPFAVDTFWLAGAAIVFGTLSRFGRRPRYGHRKHALVVHRLQRPKGSKVLGETPRS